MWKSYSCSWVSFSCGSVGFATRGMYLDILVPQDVDFCHFSLYFVREVADTNCPSATTAATEVLPVGCWALSTWRKCVYLSCMVHITGLIFMSVHMWRFGGVAWEIITSCSETVNSVNKNEWVASRFGVKSPGLNWVSIYTKTEIQICVFTGFPSQQRLSLYWDPERSKRWYTSVLLQSDCSTKTKFYAAYKDTAPLRDWQNQSICS